MLILGIETSCDETSVALLEDARILASHTFSQADIHAVFGGVVPEVASRNHLMKIKPLFDKTLNEADISCTDIDMLAVTNAPGLIGSLFVGVAFAKGLGFALNKPVIPVHHLAGHILSAELSNPDLKPPYLALVISGGHTHIYEVTGEPPVFSLWGRTIDDAAGEAFDKVSKMLGGSYPGGPFVEALALRGDSQAIKFPVALKDTPNFSFSGLKTAVLNRLGKGDVKAEDIAAGFQQTVACTLTDKILKACRQTGIKKIVVAGGVACNSFIREAFQRTVSENGLKVYFPAKNLCNDNAAMIAYAAWRLTRGSDLEKYKDMSFAAGDTRHEISA